MKKLKYFSTLLAAAAAIIAVWLVWTYYMQSPWTRDGKIRAEQVSIAPQVSGTIIDLKVKDNQLVKAGETLFRIDDTPYRIAVADALAQQAKARSDLLNARSALAKAQHEADRRRNLPKNVISAEDLDTANIALQSAQAEEAAARASLDAAGATLNHARWELEQTVVKAPVDGWITNMSTRTGDYATTGSPLFALVDSHSFHVIGYFEETKLRHISAGDRASIVLYSNGTKLQGHVSSIGRAIFDQNTGTDGTLVADIKPTIPWVRLAQRVPVRIEFDALPDGLVLVSGTTCTVYIGNR
ncbi:HlyD family secretion protein [Pluralibacter gergoviae]|uniref:HlyD family secretion protein n=1 Tax=Pluralibacter gergoviae TaxID=61647 RepID=A0A089PQR9_PLUGE|nr:HlyD family secretion protein [Pluralibacter gergoviae]AIR01241.1 efflux transporter periplasmic adaptor subunit [Pluralibacter gergoviae]AVR04495.1 HlyD family secretion protein [Pluralibacter gergoviae]EKT9641935.1 HlyD family secretion protein [Pluralibacter gergoviae]EKV0917822.1 HlyD family secretion protein [Pluralibacter gergoviae]EKV0931455.1 HlyD family secretion protein [Pluralibacter gergoviae]